MLIGNAENKKSAPSGKKGGEVKRKAMGLAEGKKQ